MHKLFGTRARAIAAASAIVFALACSDSTGPAGPKHPIVGTYALTTVMQSHTYPVNCGPGGCAHQTGPAGTAALAGTLIINDSVVAEGTNAIRLPSYSASFSEIQPCDTTNPACTPPGFQRVVTYDDGYHSLTVSGDTMGVTGTLEASGEMVVLASGRFAGDSIVGTLRWYTFLGTASEYYSGTFVARRQR